MIFFNNKIKEPQIREDIRNYLNQVQGVITRLANYNHSCKHYYIILERNFKNMYNSYAKLVR